MSYLPTPVLPPRPFRNRREFSNKGIAQELPRVLNMLGFAVDIVDYRNRSWLPRGDYQVFIGHGGHNFASLSDGLGKNCKRIYFGTGMYWKENNRRADVRLQEFGERTGVKLARERDAPESEQAALDRSEFVICIGNGDTADSFPGGKRIVTLDNAVFPLRYEHRIGNDKPIRDSFIFFAGGGNVHKGLDLLLRKFVDGPEHLHVCQRIESKFAEAMTSYIHGSPFIHFHGHIGMRSRKFRSIAERSAWAILPTCAEGQPGSILECMAHGLVPVVSRAANLDLGDVAIEIESLDDHGLNRAIDRCRKVPDDALRSMREANRRLAGNRFAPESFRANLHRELDCIVGL